MASTVQEREVIYADISQRCALTLLVSYKVQYKDRLTRNCDLFTLPTVKAMRWQLIIEMLSDTPLASLGRGLGHVDFGPLVGLRFHTFTSLD